MEVTKLISKMREGDRLALSRLISQVEDRKDRLSLMAKIEPFGGKARVIGVTGPPGAGKSTLVDRMISFFRAPGNKVGVIAIDPSSPFSGGAVLGDRIRMQEHAGDDGVFIRSLGSRGSHGGISRATREVVKLYDAFGMEQIIIETVGVGQTELDIREIAGTTIVILTPESGDAIQTLKAGILEIADIFLVNKSDREGADRILHELKAMLEIGQKKEWTVPVLPIQAVKGIGVPELMEKVLAHQATHKIGKPSHTSLTEEVREIVIDELKKSLHFKVNPGDNPYVKAGEILKEILWKQSKKARR